MRKWIDTFEEELTNTRLLKKLRTFIHKVLMVDGHENVAKAMLGTLARKVINFMVQSIKRFLIPFSLFFPSQFDQKEKQPKTFSVLPPEPKVKKN